ncbi:glycosyltransferase family 2 protein [Candidatus Woesearchaeota archaeon]|nr:glycosyltransferase family 2 protein [Candidatus Woesearchaeota archaeon]
MPAKDDEKRDRKGFSVVIPVFNEEASIKETVEKLRKVLDSTGKDYEIIIINDCSTDRTAKIIERIDGIEIITHTINKGYGYSLKDGIRKARYETIVMTDGDGTYPCSPIPEMLELSKGHEIVSGMRVGKGAKIPLLRRPAKFILTQLANFLVGMKIPDLNCGLRVIKKSDVTRYFRILPDRFSFTTTHLLSCIADSGRIRFVKIEYYKRAGKSTIHPVKDFLRFINIIFKEGLLINPIKFFSLISGLFVLLAILVFIYSMAFLGEIMDISIVVLFVGAVQIFLFGMLADLIIRKIK